MEAHCTSCGRALTESELTFGVSRCSQCAGIRAQPPTEPTLPGPDTAAIGTRIGAYFIDYVVAGIGSAAVAFAAAYAVLLFGTFVSGDFVSQTEEDAATAAALVVGLALFICVQLAYFWLGNAWGGTLGKRMLNLRVLDRMHERPLGPARGVVRLLVWWLGSIPLYLGWFWAIWDSEQQAWHDKAAGSVVLSRPAGQPWELHSEPPQPWYKKPWFFALATLTAVLIAFLVGGTVVARSSDRTFESDQPVLLEAGFDVGDCVAYEEDFVERATTCFEADAVVVDAFDIEGESYPGERLIFDFADAACPPETDVYTYPTVSTWELGDRQVACLDE